MANLGFTSTSRNEEFLFVFSEGINTVALARGPNEHPPHMGVLVNALKKHLQTAWKSGNPKLAKSTTVTIKKCANKYHMPWSEPRMTLDPPVSLGQCNVELVGPQLSSVENELVVRGFQVITKFTGGSFFYFLNCWMEKSYVFYLIYVAPNPPEMVVGPSWGLDSDMQAPCCDEAMTTTIPRFD